MRNDAKYRKGVRNDAKRYKREKKDVKVKIIKML